MTNLKKSLDAFFKNKNYVSPWIYFDEPVNNLFARASSITSVKKDHFLFRQGEVNKTIFIVRTGRFRVFYLDDTGIEKCIYIVEHGGMIGEGAAFDGLPSCVSAMAITDATLYKLNIHDFTRMMEIHPRITLEIIQSISCKERLLCSEMEYSAKPSSVRIAASLLALCSRYGKERTDGSVYIPIRFTHEELANLNNLNRVTVSKFYQSLQQKQIISNNGGYITVHDLERLKLFID